MRLAATGANRLGLLLLLLLLLLARRRVGRLVRVDAAVFAQRVPAVGAAARGNVRRLGRTTAADRLFGTRQSGRGAKGGPRRTRPALGPRAQLRRLLDRRAPLQFQPLFLVLPLSGGYCAGCGAARRLFSYTY